MSRNILHTVWYGTFLLEEKDGSTRILTFIEAERDPSIIAGEIRSVRSGQLLERERSIIGSFQVDAVTDERLSSHVPEAELIAPAVIGEDILKERMLPMELLREASEILFSDSDDVEVRDSNILSAVGALRDIDSSLNLLTERMKEWLSRYNDEEKIRLIEDRSNIEKIAALSKENGSDGEYEQFERLFGFALDDLSGVISLSRSILGLWESRDMIEGYIEREMENTAPNLAAVVGPLVGARLIHSAGGLMRLSRLPSSTVQVLGAEKMFFRFLKEGGKPPKHGVLFQHPWVHSLPGGKRGKMARALAGAASIAARMDAGGGGDAAILKLKLEKRREAILKMKLPEKRVGGRQPPFREGWWADKGSGKKGRGRRRKGRTKRI